MTTLRSFQLNRYVLDSTIHRLRNSRACFISIEQQSQNPTFCSRHFFSSNHGNSDGGFSTRNRWSSSHDHTRTGPSSYGGAKPSSEGSRTGGRVDGNVSGVRESNDGSGFGKNWTPSRDYYGGSKKWLAGPSSYGAKLGSEGLRAGGVDTNTSSVRENNGASGTGRNWRLSHDNYGESRNGLASPSSYGAKPVWEGSRTAYVDRNTYSVRENHDGSDTGKSCGPSGGDTGTRGSLTPLVETIAPSVRETNDCSGTGKSCNESGDDMGKRGSQTACVDRNTSSVRENNDGSGTGKRWSAFGDDTGTRGAHTTLVETIVPIVRENDDVEEVEPLEGGGENEEGLIGPSSSLFGVDSVTNSSWTPFADTFTSRASENDDLEETKLDEGGENDVGSVWPRKSWCSSSSYDVNLGMENSWSPFDDTIVSSVSENNDVKESESNKGGNKENVEETKFDGGNELNSEGSRKRWCSSSSYDVDQVGFRKSWAISSSYDVDSSTGNPWASSVDSITTSVSVNNDVEEAELNKGSDNEDVLETKLDGGANEVGSVGPRKRWCSLSWYDVNSGMEASWTPVDKITSRVRENNDTEEVELNEGSGNEVDSAELGHDKLERVRCNEDVGGDSGLRHSWSVEKNNDVEEVESDEGGENEVGSAILDHEKLDIGRRKWSAGEVSSEGPTYVDGMLKMKKGQGKDKVSWECSDCGFSDGKWWGKCRSCNNQGTFVKVLEGVVTNNTKGTLLSQHRSESRPQRLSDVNRGIDQLKWRFPMRGMFGSEVARVLGGGLVPGSLVLVGGDPGVGKSTLMLQIAAVIAEGSDSVEPSSVVYVSGEESSEQIGNRALRMRIGTNHIYLISSTEIEDVLANALLVSPRALIIDSIQTVYLKGVTGSAGGISQVKECTSALLRFSKKTNIPVFLIGHVNKSGDIAGPRVLEHIVDVVLYMEGEKSSSHRLLRPVKNRFGSTDELGMFEMTQSGLQVLSNPSEIYLSEPQSESNVVAGLAVAVVMDESRSFLIEIQALCVSGATASRQVNGVQASRADMIIAVLMKQAGLKIQENAVFLNVVGGWSLKETAGDLAVAAAICSSVYECPIPRGIAFIGEIGLGGELRTVPRMEKRLNTLAKLGYKKCIVPKSAIKSLAYLDFGQMTISPCSNLKEVIDDVFT